jgi:hypothetical protein
MQRLKIVTVLSALLLTASTLASCAPHPTIPNRMTAAQAEAIANRNGRLNVLETGTINLADTIVSVPGGPGAPPLSAEESPTGVRSESPTGVRSQTEEFKNGEQPP